MEKTFKFKAGICETKTTGNGLSFVAVRNQSISNDIPYSSFAVFSKTLQPLFKADSEYEVTGVEKIQGQYTNFNISKIISIDDKVVEVASGASKGSYNSYKGKSPEEIRSIVRQSSAATAAVILSSMLSPLLTDDKNMDNEAHRAINTLLDMASEIEEWVNSPIEEEKK